eukprot:TRINITY_DN12200_c0_g1_i1.p1 TRINITY_DN12200_c0_g1~~TRINITY_DN12200_c0_g1_i1.p1  ORF type:complete len:355 (-),score=88.12 TRINITY_DN12200_c0_g1_i1:160-1182(-)
MKQLTPCPGEQDMMILPIMNRQYRYYPIDGVDISIDLSVMDDSGFSIEYREDEDLFYAQVFVPTVFRKFIIGRQGRNIKKIVKETDAMISFPKSYSDPEVTICAKKKESIFHAFNRIEIIIENSAKKLPRTHTLMIPLLDTDIIENISEFIEQVESDMGDVVQGWDSKIVVPSDKLYLKIADMKLFSESDIQKACDIINAASSDMISLLESKPLSLKLEGLEPSSIDHSSVHQLSINIREIGGSRLRKLCDFLLNLLSDNDLITLDQKRKGVPLQITILDTERTLTKKTNIKAQAMPFDARRIMDQHESTSFGETTIPSIILAKTDQKEHKEVLSINLPQ